MFDVIPFCKEFDSVVQSCLCFADRISVPGVELTVQHCHQFVSDALDVVGGLEIGGVDFDASPGEQHVGGILDVVGKVQSFGWQLKWVKVTEPLQVSNLVHAEEKVTIAHELSPDRGDEVFHLFFELLVLLWWTIMFQVRSLFNDTEDLAPDRLWLEVRVILANLFGDHLYLPRDASFCRFGTVRRSTLAHARTVFFNMDSQFRWILLGGVIDWLLHLGTAPTVALPTA